MAQLVAPLTGSDRRVTFHSDSGSEDFWDFWLTDECLKET